MFDHFYNFRIGLSRIECIDELDSLLCNKALFFKTVKNWFNQFNCGGQLSEDKVREASTKTSVVSDHIDAVRELIMEDRQVTCREIKASVGISFTSVRSILHEHLAVKKISSRWLPHNLTIAQKEVRSDWCKEILAKYDGGASKDLYKIVTGDELWIYAYEPERKQQSIVWVFESEPNPTKVLCGKTLRSKWSVVCSAKLDK